MHDGVRWHQPCDVAAVSKPLLSKGDTHSKHETVVP